MAWDARARSPAGARAAELLSVEEDGAWTWSCEGLQGPSAVQCGSTAGVLAPPSSCLRRGAEVWAVDVGIVFGLFVLGP